jgi:tRNA-Thr(GGU) m(6)t(6)A37 methyltransferase TsaA
MLRFMSTAAATFEIVPIGRVHSSLTQRAGAPRQGHEGAPAARIEIYAPYLRGLKRIRPGQPALVFTWLHQSKRDVLEVHPRKDPAIPLHGVFATRSPDRPNPIGLHPVTGTAVDGLWLDVQPLEAIDGTPVVDIKPVLELPPSGS